MENRDLDISSLIFFFFLSTKSFSTDLLCSLLITDIPFQGEKVKEGRGRREINDIFARLTETDRGKIR